MLRQYDEHILKLLLVSAVGLLASVYFFEFVIGLNPCKLCLYQRIPWWLVIGITSLALVYKRRPHLVNILTILAAIIILAGGVLAAYHVGVEERWWEGPTSCSSTSSMPGTLADLKSAIMAAPVVRCEEVVWDLFGISMAGYNAIISFILGVWGIVAGIRLRQNS